MALSATNTSHCAFKNEFG